MPNYRRLARERNGAPAALPVDAVVAQAVAAVQHMAGFRRAYPLLAGWLERSGGEFALSLRRRIEGGGLLTPNQLAALERAARSAMPYDSMNVSLDDNHPEHKEMK